MLLSSKGYADSVGKTTQMSYAVYPKNAFDNGVTWSIAAGTGSATIDKVSGLLKATGIGTVTVTATANDGSGKTASTVVKIGTRLTKI